MDFTELYKSNSLVAFSPGAQFVLCAAQVNDQLRLIIRRADTFQIERAWPIDASVTASASKHPLNSLVSSIAWSCDSEYVIAVCAKQGAVHVFKLRDESWYARINAGVEGLIKAEFAPDGRTVICTSEWGLRVTIWSLVTGTASYIQYPLHSDQGKFISLSPLIQLPTALPPGYTFRADGRYFILAERHKGKDTLGVYDAGVGYRLVRHFPLPTTSLAGIALSPNGSHLAAWEGPLEYKLVVVTLAGEILTTFTPDPDPGFGIKQVEWHPSGLFIAVAGRNDKIYILDSLTWSVVATLDIHGRLPHGTPVWRETAGWLEATEGRGFMSYEKVTGMTSLNVARSDVAKAYPKGGTSQVQWNTNGSLLLARFENTPHAVHIFDFPSKPTAPESIPKLRTVLLHSHHVLRARWNPVRPGVMAICTGGQRLHTWSNEWVGDEGAEEDMAECIGIPSQVEWDCRDIRWSPDGKGLLLLGKETFCCAFEVEE